MASCLVQTTAAISTFPVGTNFVKGLVSIGGNNSTSYNWPLLPASTVDGSYVCSQGGLLILSPDEMNALNLFKATSDHYTAVSLVFASVLTALAVIWGVRRILRLFNSHSEA